MLHGLQQALGLNPEVIWAGLGLGGGIGRCQAVCGALNGGAVALGFARQGSPREDAVPQTREEAARLYKSFEAAFGHTDCRHLTGYDFQAPQGYQQYRDDKAARARCESYVAFVVRKALEGRG